MKFSISYNAPIIFLQCYLILTLIIFQFGPISYQVTDPPIFWMLILSYHLCFLLGYIVAYKLKKPKKIIKPVELAKNSEMRIFYFVLTLSLISSLISFKGVGSIYDLINPVFWIESAINGILFPGDAYNEKMSRVLTNDNGNKLLNIFLFFIAFSKILIVPFTVFFWSRLTKSIKVIALFITLLPLLSSLSNGTNKGVFDFVILYSSSLVVYFLYNKNNFNNYLFFSRKFFLIIISISFIGALSFFGSAMGSRGGNLRYIETVDPLGNISVNQETVDKSKNSAYYIYVWLSSYIVQGYYGFSLAIEKDFNTTYGFGNSIFIRRNIEGLLGIDLNKKTFQNKIDNWWGENSQWHSFYSYMANDFHFIGVGVVCFFLSFIMGNIWFSFLDTGNLYAGAMMSIFAIMIIFIPANNQIFGFLDGISAFFWVYIFWFFSTNKIKFLNK
jgi:hypothetical protein